MIQQRRAIHLGLAHIQNNQIGLLLKGQRQRVLAIARLQYLIGVQVALQQGAAIRFAIY